MVLTVTGSALDTCWRKLIRKAPSTSSVLTTAVSVTKDRTSIQVKSRIALILTRYPRGSLRIALRLGMVMEGDMNVVIGERPGSTLI